jgi:hypothetical protein
MFLESREHVPVSRILFQRDTAGSKLFIKFFFRKGNEPAYRTLIVTGDRISEIPGYPFVWYDDHANPVFRLEGGREWYEEEGKSYRFFSRWEKSKYVFKSGAVIPYEAIKTLSGVRGVVGGDFVLVRLRDKPGWIVSSPKTPQQAMIELPNDFEPDEAYASSNRLIMFDTYRPQGDKFVRRCLIYQQSADGYRLTQELPIPWMGGVYDLWPKTGDALIGALNNRHMYPTYYRFNIETKRKALLGVRDADNILFLKEDVIRTLDAAMGESK